MVLPLLTDFKLKYHVSDGLFLVRQPFATGVSIGRVNEITQRFEVFHTTTIRNCTKLYSAAIRGSAFLVSETVFDEFAIGTSIDGNAVMCAIEGNTVVFAVGSKEK